MPVGGSSSPHLSKAPESFICTVQAVLSRVSGFITAATFLTRFNRIRRQTECDMIQDIDFD